MNKVEVKASCKREIIEQLKLIEKELKLVLDDINYCNLEELIEFLQERNQNIEAAQRILNGFSNNKQS